MKLNHTAPAHCVSVITPTYNRAETLGRAIESVLAQTFKDLEMLVIDDGSTDQTSEVVAQFGSSVRSITQPNRGVSAARNRGLREARGAYVAFLDSDDEWLPEKLDRQVAHLQRDSSLGFVYAMARVVNGEGIGLGHKPAQPHPDTLEELLRGDFIPTLTVVARRTLVEAVGGFDESLSGPEDYDLWLRLAARGPFAGVHEPLAVYHQSTTGLSADPSRIHRDHLKTFTKLMDDPRFATHRPLLRERLAVTHYLLAKALYDERRFAPARRHFVAAVSTQPMVGSRFIRPTDTRFTRMAKRLKPYLAVAASTLMRWTGTRPRGSRRAPARILFIEIGSGFGGSASSLARLCTHLDRRRFEPIVIAHGTGGHLARLKQLGIRVYDLPRPAPQRYGWLTKIRGFGFVVSVPPLAIRIARICSRERIDLLHVNNGIASQLAGILAARLIGVPVLCHFRGYDPLNGVSRFFSRWVRQFVCTASRIQAIHQQQLDLSDEKFCVVHNGFEMTRFDASPSREEARRLLGLPQEAKIVTLIGRLVQGKGYPQLIEATPRLIREVPSLLVLLVGDVPPGSQNILRPVLEQQIEQLGVEPAIRFLGWRKDVGTVLAASDIIAVPSTCEEGGPLVVLEAMAMRKAVVASRIGGATDMVEHGRTGLLIEPGESAALADALAELLGDAERAREMGEAGRRRLEMEFSVEREIRQIQAVYERLLTNHR